jgi:hypothetical protein
MLPRDQWSIGFKLGGGDPECKPERVCAECKKALYRWTPAHPVEGKPGVLCNWCWMHRSSGRK